MITKVKLKNWRSHADSTLEFTPGTNALIGIMGSGKSSIMDAICFALFGTFPNLQSKKLKLDDVIMKKPSEKNVAEVEVVLDLNGTKYTIKRSIERGKGTMFSEISAGGNVLESPNSSRVSEAVEKNLKVNYELFSKAIYSEQNALDYFLTIPRGQRMKRIDELLMIDKFEKARTNAVTLANRVSDRRSAKQSVIEQIDVETINQILKELRAIYIETSQEINSLRKKTVDASQKRKALEGEFEGLMKVKEEFEFLKRDERGIEKSLEVVSKNLAALEQATKGLLKEKAQKDFDETKRKISETNAELRKKKTDFEAATSAISDKKSNASSLKKEIDLLGKEYEKKLARKKEYEQFKSEIGADTERQISETKKLLDKATEDATKTYAKISDLNEFIVHLQSPETKCPICETILSEERKKLLIVQKYQQIKQLQETFENLKAQKEMADEKLEKAREAAEKMQMLLTEIAGIDVLRKDLEDLKKNFVETSNEVFNAENSLTNMRREVQNFEERLRESELRRNDLELLMAKFGDYEEKKFEFEQLTMERQQVESRLQEKEKKISGKDLLALDSELKQTIAEEREYDVRINEMEKLLKERMQRIEGQEEKLKEAEKYKEEVLRLEQTIRNLKIFSQALEQTQVELRQEFIIAVNHTMNEIWQAIYPYHDLVGVRLQVEEGDYVLQLQERSGSWINVEGIASGGERSIAALALRIAFSLVLAPQLRMLILDEPTANLDANAIEVLGTTLRERISDIIDQTFLITHDEKLENAVTGSLYKLEREKEKDGVTKVINIA
ncbi:MAG TPA: AAA family ATPase [archaeon]|uniref:Uncharacterized protein n=1 Tax=Candidatus Wolfebacteria bacterium RIFCSPLOWO2_01_FULL_47_17b TaxID=1802558 RepID=A0A1F8E2B9_9BACT|nr:MAG: hypothetical protein A2935_03755 [Candidatus Wolfebacteria bacterium RIFCSPLOWO2_01_FULL_47_17b]HLC39708.1 AAA family ATPase [archaeon]